MADRVEFVDRLAADAGGRAVRSRKIELGFQCFETVKQLVVDAVGDQWVVVDVVAVVVFADRRPEPLDLLFGFVG